MKKINCKDSSFIIFIIIAIFYAIGNFFWWKLNTPIIPNDISSLHFYDLFKNGWLYYNAPLITWIMKIIFSVFGKEYFDLQIIIMNYMFFLMALYFIYKTGLELKDKETGNIAMILFALTPAVYINSVHYGHKDWHVMVAIIINIYCLIKTNSFRDKKWSILYGLSVGFGLLIKDEFLACFFMPWLYVVIRSLIEKSDKNKIINILITIIIGSLIAGCHYFRFIIIRKILADPIIEPFPIFSFESLRITTIGLSEYLLSPPIFILFIIGLIYFIYKYKSQNKWIILLWFIVPWTIITFMPHHKLAEYCLCFVPALILIISIFFANIKSYILLIITITICSFQYVCLLYETDNALFKISFNDIKYYDASVFDKLSLRDKKEIDFYIKVLKSIPSINRGVFLDASEINLGAFRTLLNLYFLEGLKVLSYYSVHDNSFDLFITSDKGLFYKDNLIVLEGEYLAYMNASIMPKKIKERYINRRLKEVENFKYFIENKFYLLNTIPYNDSLIKVYKLIEE